MTMTNEQKVVYLQAKLDAVERYAFGTDYPQWETIMLILGLPIPGRPKKEIDLFPMRYGDLVKEDKDV